MESIEAKFPICRDTVTALYLSKLLSLDPLIMMYLHKKYGEDVFYFFYMLAGRKVSFPNVDALLKSKASASIIYHRMTTDSNVPFDLMRDKECFFDLCRKTDSDGKNFIFRLDDETEREREI